MPNFYYLDRKNRIGMVEAVFGENKTPSQIAEIVNEFQLNGEIGFCLCQLSFEVHDKQTCEETRLVCFEKGIYFDTGAILPFGIAPKDPPEGTYYREQTPENLAIMIFASIVTRRPCRPEGCGCQSKHERSFIRRSHWDICFSSNSL